MMNSQDFHLVIRTLSPVHVPDASVSTPSGTATPTTRALYKEGKTTYREVVLPSNGARGRLRRKLADRIAYALADKGITLSSDAARGFLNAKATGVPASESASISMINDALEKPFSGLLGGGKFILNSKLSFGTINLICDRHINNGYVPEFLSDIAVDESARITQKFTKISKDSTIDSSVFDGLPNVVDNYYASLEEWRALIALNKEERNSSKDAEADADLKAAKEQALEELKEKLNTDLLPMAKANIADKVKSGKLKVEGEAQESKAVKTELNKLVKKELAEREKLSKKLDIQNMMEIETLATGLQFHSLITYKERQMNTAQLGLLLLGIQDVAKMNFGINGGIGHGRVSFSMYDADHNLIMAQDAETGAYEFSGKAAKWIEEAMAHLESLDKSDADLIEAIYGS